MKRPLLVVALLAALPMVTLALHSVLEPAVPAPRFALASSSSTRPAGGADPLPAVGDAAAEPPETVLRPGDRAPDFEYRLEDGPTLHLHDVLAQGHALLVFQPSATQLGELEHERMALAQRGILVIAVMDRSERAMRSLAARLDLHFTMIPDSRAVIGGQFNVLGASTRRPEPAWFAIDRNGRIRALERWHVPDSGFATLATDALHLPAPDAIAPSGYEDPNGASTPR